MNCRIKLRTWTYILAILFPLFLSPLAVLPYQEAKCGYILLVMAVFWLLEPMPMAVTALIPVPLLPLFGIMSSSEVSVNYMKEVLMMFLGGLTVAVAVEHSNLHQRIALKVLLMLGTDLKRLLLGFMMTTMFLSMWISNTATTAMMIPIAEAVLKEINQDTPDVELDSLPKGGKVTEQKKGKQAPSDKKLKTLLLLGVAYSANCGGTGTITGTSPNMIMKGFVEETYPESTEITYASWMMYNVPGMVLCVLGAWFFLQVLYLGFCSKTDPRTQVTIRMILEKKYKDLGKISFHETSVLILFILLVFFWVFREPKFIPGWASVLNSDISIGDSAMAIGIALLLFLIPAEPWNLNSSPPLLDWKTAQMKIPWGLILLIGGGYAIAEGSKKSGLALWLGTKMSSLSFLSPAIIVVVLCVMTTLLTEIISNSTACNILLPVVNEVALAIRVNPLLFLLPITICSSYAFMLPVATGPTALVFESGGVTKQEMMKAGVIMNIICCCAQLLMINTLGVALFDINSFPSWANGTRHQAV